METMARPADDRAIPRFLLFDYVWIRTSNGDTSIVFWFAA